MNVVLYGKPEALTGLEELLQVHTKGITVSAFYQFSAALQYFKAHDADLMLLDADDNAVSWQYITERFKGIDSHMKVVLISDTMDNAVRAYEAGIFDYLLKPVKEKQLERVLGKYRQQASNRPDIP